MSAIIETKEGVQRRFSLEIREGAPHFLCERLIRGSAERNAVMIEAKNGRDQGRVLHTGTDIAQRPPAISAQIESPPGAGYPPVHVENSAGV